MIVYIENLKEPIKFLKISDHTEFSGNKVKIQKSVQQ